MAQLIESTNIETRSIFGPSSRYINQNVIYYTENRLISLDIYNRQPYTRVGNEKIMVISKGVEYRPDLVSYDVYGFVDNWWRILEANNIKDIWEFKAGKTIFLPNKII
jgi:hypothetical protein